jgi:hypothetical protein
VRLHTIIDTMLPQVPEVARDILTKLRAEPAERLEQLADILLKDRLPVLPVRRRTAHRCCRAAGRLDRHGQPNSMPAS